jgi:hypothetical protein
MQPDIWPDAWIASPIASIQNPAFIATESGLIPVSSWVVRWDMPRWPPQGGIQPEDCANCAGLHSALFCRGVAPLGAIRHILDCGGRCSRGAQRSARIAFGVTDRSYLENCCSCVMRVTHGLDSSLPFETQDGSTLRTSRDACKA